MPIRAALLMATVVLLAASAPVAAATPAWEQVTIDDTFFLPRTSEACGFDVFEHDEGQLKFQVIEYADGSLRFKDLAVRVSQSLVAPSRGTTVELQPAAATCSYCIRTVPPSSYRPVQTVTSPSQARA